MTKRILGLGFTLTILAALSLGTLGVYRNQTSEVYVQLSLAETLQQADVTPLILAEHRPILRTKGLQANLSTTIVPEFTDAREYLLEDKTTGNLFLLETESDSRLPEQLATFADVVVEPNHLFTMQSLDQSDHLINSETPLIDWQAILQGLGIDEDIRFPASEKLNKPITIAVLDSGLNAVAAYKHKIVLSQDQTLGWSSFNTIADITDKTGHGTHVSGIIMALSELIATDSEQELMQILPLQILNENNETTLGDVLVALDYAAQHNVDFINMSLGSPQKSRILEAKLASLAAAGTILVAPSGNSGSDTVLYPAKYDSTIAVGALNALQRRAPYSNYGQEVTVMSPGNVLSLGTNGLKEMQGTSQATAVVTGLCAVSSVVTGLTGCVDLAAYTSDELPAPTIMPLDVLEQLKIPDSQLAEPGISADEFNSF